MLYTLQGIPVRFKSMHATALEARRTTLTDVPDCLFCRIVAGEVRAHAVLETDDLVAFLDHRPVFKGHVLLVPREHVVTLPDLPAALRDPFLAAGQQLAAAMVTALGAQGSFVAMNNTVSQSVPHLHLHVVPRTKGDGLRGFFWPRHKYSSEDEMREYAGRLTGALADQPAAGD
jgi:histidine triad (HIT) family protein